MNKTLLKSVREYKKQSVLAPFFVILEVLMEVLIPMEMAKIIDVGIMQGNLSYIVRRGLILVIMAMLALYFGIIAGKMAATVAQKPNLMGETAVETAIQILQGETVEKTIPVEVELITKESVK